MSRRERITHMVRKYYGHTKEEQDAEIERQCSFWEANLETLRSVSAERRKVWDAEAKLGTETK